MLAFILLASILQADGREERLPATPSGIWVRTGDFQPDLDFLERKYVEACRCLGGCRMNFTVEIVTDDLCFECPSSSSGYCGGMTGFIGEKAFVFLTENLRSAAGEVVRTQYKDTAPGLLRKCGKEIDIRMNEEYQDLHGEWPDCCRAMPKSCE